MAVEELEEDPDLLGLTIMDLRAYAAAKREFDHPSSDDPKTRERIKERHPMMPMVEDNFWKFQRERKAERDKGLGSGGGE